MFILQIFEYILKFIAQVLFGIVKISAWFIDALGFTDLSKSLEDPNKENVLTAADDLKTVEQEEKGDVGNKWRGP